MAYLEIIARIQGTDERYNMMTDFFYTNRIYFAFYELRRVPSTFITF